MDAFFFSSFLPSFLSKKKMQSQKILLFIEISLHDWKSKLNYVKKIRKRKKGNLYNDESYGNGKINGWNKAGEECFSRDLKEKEGKKKRKKIRWVVLLDYCSEQSGISH